jgi:hypothetical protein
MFKALGDAGIHIANITTSEIKISCIVPKEHGRRALQVVHDAFGLGQPREQGAADETTEPGASAPQVHVSSLWERTTSPGA